MNYPGIVMAELDLLYLHHGLDFCDVWEAGQGLLLPHPDQDFFDDWEAGHGLLFLHHDPVSGKAGRQDRACFRSFGGTATAETSTDSIFCQRWESVVESCFVEGGSQKPLLLRIGGTVVPSQAVHHSLHLIKFLFKVG